MLCGSVGLLAVFHPGAARACPLDRGSPRVRHASARRKWRRTAAGDARGFRFALFLEFKRVIRSLFFKIYIYIPIYIHKLVSSGTCHVVMRTANSAGYSPLAAACCRKSAAIVVTVVTVSAESPMHTHPPWSCAARSRAPPPATTSFRWR